jgi:MFS family permease
MGELVAYRGLQGLGAGGLMVLALASIADIVPMRERGRYQGYFGAVFGASSILGPLLGGFLTQHASWRWVFYVNLPLGIVALAVTTAVLPNTTSRTRPVVDYPGFVLLAAAVACLVLTTTWGGVRYAWGSTTIVGLAVATAVLAAVFLLVERRAAEPVIPPRLFTGGVVPVAMAVSFLVGLGLFGAIIYLPLFLQLVTSASPTNSGLLMVPLMVGLLGSSIASGRAISRTGRYRVFPIVGTAVATGAMLLLGTMSVATPALVAMAWMVLLGVGLGLVMQVMVLATQNAVDRGDLGVATATATFFRSVGGSVGVSVFGAIFNAHLRANLAHLAPAAASHVPAGTSASMTAIRALPPALRVQVKAAYADALTTVFGYGAPIMLVAFVLTWLLHDVPLRDRRHGAPDTARELSAASAPGTAEPDAIGG